MKSQHSKIRVLHVWDTRVNSGSNIDDRLVATDLDQISVSRILVRGEQGEVLPQRALHILSDLKSPYPKSILSRQVSKIIFKFFLKRQVQIYKPDVIFFHFGQTAATYMNCVRSFKIPFVIAFYGHDVSVALNQPRWLKKYKIFAKTSGRYLVLSDDVKRRVTNLGINPNRITVYNFPLDLTLYKQVQKKSQYAIYTLIIPARLVEKKGHIVLFQAIAQLKVSGYIVKLIVVGYGGSWSLFKNLASNFGIAEQIEWVDSAKITKDGNFDLLYSSLLVDADLVVLPCITSSDGDDEAGPALVLCLAQASGTAVLTTPFEGHEVSIEQGETGFLVEENDPIGLAEKILFCMNNPLIVDRVAEAGKVNVQRVFDQESNLSIILEVILKQAQGKN